MIYRMTDRTDRHTNTQPDSKEDLGLGARKRANKKELNYKQKKSELSSYSNLNKMANNTTEQKPTAALTLMLHGHKESCDFSHASFIDFISGMTSITQY